jgi:hypothetical protein
MTLEITSNTTPTPSAENVFDTVTALTLQTVEADFSSNLLPSSLLAWLLPYPTL